MDNEVTNEIPLLTFNSLYNLLREEKKNKSLKSIPEAFYEALDKFFLEKRNQIEKLRNLKENEKLKKEKLIFLNSKKISKELLNIRCTKIANIAIKNSLFNEEILPEKDILEKEKKFLENVKKALIEIAK